MVVSVLLYARTDIFDGLNDFKVDVLLGIRVSADGLESEAPRKQI